MAETSSGPSPLLCCRWNPLGCASTLLLKSSTKSSILQVCGGQTSLTTTARSDSLFFNALTPDSFWLLEALHCNSNLINNFHWNRGIFKQLHSISPQLCCCGGHFWLCGAQEIFALHYDWVTSSGPNRQQQYTFTPQINKHSASFPSLSDRDSEQQL